MFHTIQKLGKYGFVFLLLLAGLSSGARAQAAKPASPFGTWKGESICQDKNRPACKNEVVVYRMEAVPGKPDRVLWLADKIIDGERVPMGKLEFQYDAAKGSLLCDFRVGQTHGVWEFQISGDTLSGRLLILPEKTLGRLVKAERVDPAKVPPPPARKRYDDQ